MTLALVLLVLVAAPFGAVLFIRGVQAARERASLRRWAEDVRRRRNGPFLLRAREHRDLLTIPERRS